MAEQLDVDSIDFRPAEGGLTSETRYNGKNGSFGNTKRAIHPNLGSAMKHIKKTIGHHFAKKSSMKKG